MLLRKQRLWFTAVFLLIGTFLWNTVNAANPGQSLAQTGCSYWIAAPPLGDDNNPGSEAQPWATLEHASEHVPDTGCTVWVKDGTYSGNNRINRRFSTPTAFKAVNPYRAVMQNSGSVLNVSGATNVTFEGLIFQHSGPGATPLVVIIDGSSDGWAEYVTMRNNIFRDSYNNDLLKILDGVRFATVEHNVFYNQGPNEDHMDVNSVTDITIQDNVFFNDYASSGRVDPGDTKAYITVKDSNEGSDGLLGSERVHIRRNIFLNWQGGSEPFLQIGNDGKPYHEAKDIQIENNLMIGNSPDDVNAVLAVAGVKDVTFANNTVVGDLPARAYAFRTDRKALNPVNENILFYNNIWSDPTGTMGAGPSDSANEFSDGDVGEVDNLVLNNNLYWNGGAPIPAGETVDPMVDDVDRVVANPLLASDHSAIVLPIWNGSAFLSGNTTNRQEFERLVYSYGSIPAASPAIDQADPATAPQDDILGRARSAQMDMGAFEFFGAQSGTSTPTATHTPPPSPTAVSGNGPSIDAVSSGSTAGSSVSFAHTTSGSNRLLLVGISLNNDNLETVSSVSYGGAPLTFIGQETYEDDARVELWQLIDPPLGTGDVAVTFSADLMQYAVVGAISFTGVNQSTPLGSFAGNHATSSAASVTVPSEANELVLGVFSCETCGSVAGSSPAVQRWSATLGGGKEIGAGFSQPGQSGQVTFEASLGTSDHWVFAAVSVRPSASTGITPPPTATLSPEATATKVPTQTPLATATDAPTDTPAPTHTPTAPPTSAPTNTATPWPTNTATASPTNTPPPAPTHTATPVPTGVPAATGTAVSNSAPKVDAVSTESTAGSALSFAHTTSGGNRLLLVGISINNDNFETVNSVAYGGIPLTFVGAETHQDDARVEIWQLVNPPLGTSNVTVTFSADLKQYAVVSAISFNDVDQTNPLSTFTGNHATNNAASITVPSADNNLVLGVFSCETCGDVTGQTPAVERWNVSVGRGKTIGVGFTQPGQNGQVSFEASLSSRDHWAFAAVSIRPADSP